MASRRATTVPSSFKSIPTDSKRQFLYSLFLLHCCCNILRCVICFKLQLILMCRKHTEAQRFLFDALYILFFSDRPRRIQKQFISRNTFTRIFLCKLRIARLTLQRLAQHTFCLFQFRPHFCILYFFSVQKAVTLLIKPTTSDL